MLTLSQVQFLELLKKLRYDHEAFKTAIFTRCDSDLELFAKIFFGRFCRYPFNVFHKDCFARWNLGERGVRWVDAAPRGSAKSTMVSLIKPVHDICYGKEKYITIFSNTEAQALQKLKDIKTELLDNELLVNIYGPFFPNKRVSDKTFVATSRFGQTMVSGFGVGTQVRGIRFGADRPSKIILDDVEHSEEVHSELLRQKLENWFKEDLTYLGAPDTNLHFIGTVLHPESLLCNLLKNPNYSGKIYKSVINWSEREDLWQKWEEKYVNLSNLSRFDDAQDFYLSNESLMLIGTQVLWPEKSSYLDLMKRKIEIGKTAFLKEDQNSPLPSQDALFQKIHEFHITEYGLQIIATKEIIPMSHLRYYAALDPSAGDDAPKKGSKGDYSCVLLGAQDLKGRVYILEDITKRMSPTKTIDALFEFCERQYIEKFAIETNLFRNLLLPNIATAKKQREAERKAAGFKNWGIKANLYDIVNTENKKKRIYTLEPKITNGWIMFNRNLSQEFKNQLESFPLNPHDDAPDALHMLWSLIEGRYNSNGVNIDALAR